MGSDVGPHYVITNTIMMDGPGTAGAKSCGEHRKIATRFREISFVIVMNNSGDFNH